jgi:hypothetical protein
MEIPVVPSLSVLRPRRTEQPERMPGRAPDRAPDRAPEPEPIDERPRREAPDLSKGVRPDTAARVEAMHEESLRAAAEEDDRGPRSPELPSWDDILFGTRRNR